MSGWPSTTAFRTFAAAEFRRVTFPKDSPRGGLLGQGSILLLTSYSTRTSPVLRGKYVLENLLASPPPPPPPNVPSLNTDGAKSGEQLSLREAMVRHRANPACANCHARMDPIGFAMENFDAVGKWRDHDGGNAIDVSSKLADGTVVDGLAGVKQLILKDPQRFVGAVTEKLLMYGIGRNVQYFDAPAVRKIVREAAASNYKFDDAGVGRGPERPISDENREADREDRKEEPMTFITKKRMARRTILKGLGASLALPMLDSMIPALSARDSVDAASRMGLRFARRHLRPVEAHQARLRLRADAQPEAARKAERPVQHSHRPVAPGGGYQGRRQRRPHPRLGGLAHRRSRV